MIITGTKHNEMERYIVPAETLPAICVGVIDCGTQQWEYMGEAKSGKKLRLQWELPTEEWEDDEGRNRARTISHEYTASLHEKSNLRKNLISWRGRDFTEEELAGFDMTELLGKPCMLSVIHKNKANGTGSYAKIDAVTKLAKGITVPEVAITPLTTYSLEDGDNEVFRAFPEWIQNIISSCVEWQSKPAKPEVKKAAEKVAKALEGKVVPSQDEMDVPF